MNANIVIRHLPLAALAAATVIALAACGAQTAGDAGVELIEGELGAELDLGPLEATCDEPAAEEVGETFSCTATTGAGDVVEFVGLMEASDEIVVGASNVVLVEDLDFLEDDAVATGAEEFQVDPSTLSVDCPDENTLLVDDRVTCVITETPGASYELFITLETFVAGEGFPGWAYSVGDEIS